MFSNLAVDALFVGSAGNFGESRRSQGQEQQPITDYPERAGFFTRIAPCGGGIPSGLFRWRDPENPSCSDKENSMLLLEAVGGANPTCSWLLG